MSKRKISSSSLIFVLRMMMCTSCYVFYDPANFVGQTDTEAKRLKKNGGEVKLNGITSTNEFITNWNSMDESLKIGGVSMIFYGSPHTINIDWGEKQYLTSLSNGLTPKGNEAVYIGEMAEKTIDQITILSCNAGHLDHIDDNVISAFLNFIGVNSVIACDGNVAYDREYGFHSIGFGNYIPRLSTTQKSFYKELTSGKRLPSGFHVFTEDYYEGSISKKAFSFK